MSAEHRSDPAGSHDALLEALDRAGVEGGALPDPAQLPRGLPGRLEGALALLRQLDQVLGGAAAPAGPAASPPPASLGRFEVRRELGRGGFGVVFLAHDPQLRREVALKVPHAEALLHPDLRARFLREARAAAGLDHANVVPVYEAAEAGAVCYIA